MVRRERHKESLALAHRHALQHLAALRGNWSREGHDGVAVDLADEVECDGVEAEGLLDDRVEVTHVLQVWHRELGFATCCNGGAGGLNFFAKTVLNILVLGELVEDPANCIPNS